MFELKSVLSRRIVSLGIPIVGCTIFFWPALRCIRFSPQEPKIKPSDLPPPTEGVGMRATSFRCLLKFLVEQVSFSKVFRRQT